MVRRATSLRNVCFFTSSEENGSGLRPLELYPEKGHVGSKALLDKEELSTLLCEAETFLKTWQLSLSRDNKWDYYPLSIFQLLIIYEKKKLYMIEEQDAD
ncbi:hypothetical protein T4D_13284 [Trichinella pseudospiralis]|uniref:Uncharacterized protein n=1 Tax=Trichinella pseudospiralis TaxID=6337 RepID=A0A0V1FI10_TRIPS|nr:hypothetical protein T4D_13284 [Trichinella pseudospiralis]